MYIMKNLKFAAVLMAAVLAAVPMTSCKEEKGSAPQPVSSSTNKPSKTNAEMEGIAEIEHKIAISEDANINNVQYKLNRIIDPEVVRGSEKFIYADVTIKNNTDEACEFTAINNFYIILPDKTEISPKANAQVYAINHLNGYEKLAAIDAGQEWNGYVCFSLDKSVKGFSFCFFPTGKNYSDKENVIRTEIAESDIIKAPEGLFTPDSSN